MGIKACFRTSVIGLLAAGVLAGGMAAGAGTAAACPESTASSSTNSHSYASRQPQVRPGATGKHVLALQLNLRNRGYQLTGTGFYGAKTLAAVRAFQRAHGIKDSGIVGSKTWQTLFGRMDLGLTLGPAVTPKFGIEPGERNFAKVNHLGATLKRLYPTESGWAVRGGEYGPEMVAMVKRFQRAVGIKASGIVGPKTWSAMYDVISVSGGWGR